MRTDYNMDDNGSRHGVPVEAWLKENEMTSKAKSTSNATNKTALWSASKPVSYMFTWLITLLICCGMVCDSSWQFISWLLIWYTNQVHQNLLVTKSVSCGLIGICGDAVAQQFEWSMRGTAFLKKGTHYNSHRGMANLADGLFISGPLMHWSYTWLEHVLPITGSLTAIVHSLADCIILDSIFVAIAIVMTGIVEGHSLWFVKNQIQQEFGCTMKAIWVTDAMLFPVEVLCFWFLPLSLRTLAVNFIDVVWDAVISFMVHRSRIDQFVPSNKP